MDIARVMGLDIGDRRIGIALSDLLMITAQGQETYTRGDSADADAEYLAQFAKKNNVNKIVCGLPKNMDGSIGEQAIKTQEFAELLKSKTNAEIIFFDERLSTSSAHRTLLQADMSRQKRKKVVDKIASVYILQAYLDSVKNY